ncbi:formylglycine-generating enzyme family protein [uncultured Paraglaciecola sp.]|uniref:formylglycine-generating enzyme family protein n=1 Tax=uncultured Paraglaciecola sp. TaxID=1765024 RepID=UPI0030D7529B|tara:strand:+ start:18130 stop:18903 length:774 start_codon:yes stop_codon:yes gene_type:complete
MIAWLLTSLVLVGTHDMVEIPAGDYRPLYMSKDSPQTKVEAFSIDIRPVTNQQYLQFIAVNPSWQPKVIPQLFAEPQYLQHWSNKGGEILPSNAQLNSPVINVSWFAAQAYCRSLDRRLPTVAEWERVASASETLVDGSQEKNYQQRILAWYSQPSRKQLPDVGGNVANFWGVQDLHGLIWEWTQDFNSALVSGESRGDSSIDQKLFCAAGAQGAADPSDYAAFMRFGFRSSLQAKFTLPNLGFRCASSKEQINVKR